MKHYLMMVVAAVLSFTASAADQVTFTRLAYENADYLGQTFAAGPETPFAAMISPYKSGKPDVYEIILLNENLEKVYSFSIRVPEDHDYVCRLEFLGEGSDLQQIFVTQYLFNDDDLYEVVLGGNYSKWIYNENGEFLGEIPTTSETLYERDGQIYFYADREETPDGERTAVLYKLNKGNNAVMTVSAENTRLTASPNPVKADENVTITLPAELSSTTMVKVFSTDGVLLINKECPKGESTISIPAYRLASGVNPVVVMDTEGNILSTGKIIRE